MRSRTGRSSNALVNTAAGATWVSIHHGGGTGIGYSQHAGMVVVADGTDLAARKLERVLTTDPGMGVVRHVDAGYQRAIEVARERGVHIPMLDAVSPGASQPGTVVLTGAGLTIEDVERVARGDAPGHARPGGPGAGPGVPATSSSGWSSPVRWSTA